jgi:hypothetical protein
MASKNLHDMLARRVESLKSGQTKTAAVTAPPAVENTGLQEPAYVPVDTELMEKVAASIEYLIPRLGDVEEDRDNKTKLADMIRVKQAQSQPTVTDSPGGSPIIGQNQTNPMGGSSEHDKPLVPPLSDGAPKNDANVNPIAHANRSGSLQSKIIDQLTGAQPERDGGNLTEQPNVVASGEFSASSPSGGGNEARSFLQSNQAAINADKRDLRSPTKKALSAFLNEPAWDASNDPVVGKMWDKGSETSKVAAAVARTTGQVPNVTKLAHMLMQRKLAQMGAPAGAPPMDPSMAGGAPPPGAPPGVPDGAPPPAGAGGPAQMQTMADPVAVAKLEAATKMKDAEKATLQAALAAVKAGAPPDAGIVTDEEIQSLIQQGQPGGGAPAPMPAAPAPQGGAA